MARVAVISNPKSQRNAKGALADVEAVLAGRPDVHHRQVLDFAELDRIVDGLIRDRVEVIVVNGGDGTVQAVLTALASRVGQGGEGPGLAILSGGMTNVIAKDVGLDGTPPKALARLLERLEAAGGSRTPGLDRLTRPLIGLAITDEKPPVYGMFFGAAGFYQAVLLAQERVRPRGFAGTLASATSLIMVLLRLIAARPGADDRLYRGEAMALDLDGSHLDEQPYLLLIATTLDRLILGLMPFWGSSGEAIRYTSVTFPPKHLKRALLPVLRGRPRPWMRAEGYRSGTASDMVIDIKSPVVLDGEIFHPEPGRPIRLRGDRRATFIRC